MAFVAQGLLSLRATLPVIARATRPRTGYWTAPLSTSRAETADLLMDRTGEGARPFIVRIWCYFADSSAGVVVCDATCCSFSTSAG